MPRRSLRNTAPQKQKSKRLPSTPSLEQPKNLKRQKKAVEEPPSRRKDTQKTTSSTEKKSKYFQQESSDLNIGNGDASKTRKKSLNEASMSDSLPEDSHGAESEVAEDSAEASEEDEDEDFSEEDRSNAKAKASFKRNRKSTVARTVTEPQTSRKGGSELWREGVKTGLEPGTEVFIKLPAPRDEGGIPYEAGTIHPNTILFLKDLKDNNDREWMKIHDVDYRKAKKDWDSFVESLNEKISEKDETIPELPAKDLVFRVYRDVRFSRDQTPYKLPGRKGPYAAYYLHLEPGKCFIGSGLWMPEASKLALIRQDIDRNSRRLKAILTSQDVRDEILGGIPNDEIKAVKAFVNQNKESALKTKPKGYDADNKNIELLRLRSFSLSKKLADKDLRGPEAIDRVAHIVGIMVQFVTYLNNIVMPDPEDEEDDEDE